MNRISFYSHPKETMYSPILHQQREARDNFLTGMRPVHGGFIAESKPHEPLRPHQFPERRPEGLVALRTLARCAPPLSGVRSPSRHPG